MEERRDPIVNTVIKKLQHRSSIGIQKYNTTLEENNTDDFLTHLQEELMDGSLYCEKIKKILATKGYSKLEEIPNKLNE